jgi:hypothetical protein
MAIQDKFDYKKVKKDIIEALKTVLELVENSEKVTSANVEVRTEYDESIKDTVWQQKYPNGWKNVNIGIRYKVKDNVQACTGSGGSGND